MSQKHTPTPWRKVVDIEGHPTSYRVMDANGDNVCVPCYGHDERGITEANANMIVAAPDLLASARDFVALYDNVIDMVGPEVKAKVERARVAIAKAEGR